MEDNKKKAIETMDILEYGYKTEKRIHPGYLEYERAKEKNKKGMKKYKIPRCFGKWQYFFIKGNLKISMIQINDRPLIGQKSKWVWEIHAFEDKRLFQDTKKFPTKKAAMEEVERILSE